MRSRIQQLVEAWREENVSDQEMVELNQLLRQSEEARAYFRTEAELNGLIQAAATTLMVEETTGQTKRTHFRKDHSVSGFGVSWVAVLTTVAGLFIGAFFMSVAWAIASPRMTADVERLLSYANGSFEDAVGHVPSGFPKTTGVWSGDHAIVVSPDGLLGRSFMKTAPVGTKAWAPTNVEIHGSVTAIDGKQLLQFIEPGLDEASSDSQAVSCDVFQLVDLRSLRPQWSNEVELSLELSANFLDARLQAGVPVTFFCQMFLFSGDPEMMHSTWPSAIKDAVASSKSFQITHGDSATPWTRLAARCLIPTQADFAVIQLAARPDVRPAKLDSLYVDDVKLFLKSQPVLPMRVVQQN